MKNKPWKIIVLFSLCLNLFLAACTPPPTPTLAPTALPEPTVIPFPITDGRGKQIDLPQPAQRVISMAPSNTEILFAIGADDQVVGRESFSDYPAAAQSLPDIGGGFAELNTELILSLKPDLILAAEITPPEQVQALEELGLTVFVLKNPQDFEGLFGNLQTVAALVGREREATGLVTELRARVQRVREKVSLSSYLPLVFYELDATDPNAPYTAGPGTFVDTLIQMAGGQNLGASLQGAWVQISVEELLTRNPDIILLGDYTWGGVTPDQVAGRAGWQALQAIKNAKIFTFDDNLVSRPGPRLVDGLEAMARLLHPELFQ